MQCYFDDVFKLECEGFVICVQWLQVNVVCDKVECEYQKVLNDLQIFKVVLFMLLCSGGEVWFILLLFVYCVLFGDVVSFECVVQVWQLQIVCLCVVVVQVEQGVCVQQVKFKLIVYLFGQYDFCCCDEMIIDFDWVFGIGLKYIFLLFSLCLVQICVVCVQQEQVEVGLCEVENQVVLGVCKVWNELEIVCYQYVLFDSSIEQLCENLCLQELVYCEGQVILLDVIDVWFGLGGVCVECVQVVYQYDVVLVQLLEISGQMDCYDEF